MHDAFEQFAAFNHDAIDNKALLSKGGKLRMPVLALGPRNLSARAMADDLRFVASDVTSGIVPAPATGSWKKIRKRPSSSSRSSWQMTDGGAS